jgi:predicted DNA-binding WGR domain protein
MKQAYLENTIDNHDKFYHMMENKDGVSFTASWGKIGSDGRSYVYDMSEWDNKYQEKINKGYENISGVGSNVTPPSNWIQGMSVAQRKKQGITTVSPPKKAKKKTDKKIHYDVGQVDVEVNHSHQNKLRILKMTMENWSHDDGKNYALDSRQGRLYEADLYKVTDLMDEGREILTKEEMIDMNILFKTYGGERKTN